MALLESQIIAPSTFQEAFMHPDIITLEQRLLNYEGLSEGEDRHRLFYQAHGYLILRLASMNGQRNGALRQMTVKCSLVYTALMTRVTVHGGIGWSEPEPVKKYAIEFRAIVFIAP
jgi:hypothetical protein